MLPGVKIRGSHAAAALVLAASVSLGAHHALNAEYDSNAPVTLTGRIVRVEWTNPHSFLEVDCPTPDGQRARWRVEAGGPAALTEAGITREMLAVGTQVTINGFRAKNGSMAAWGGDITFASGETRALTDSRLKAVDDFAPPSRLEQLMSSYPFLPYLVGAAPVLVFLAGVIVLRRRRGAGSVPQ